MKGDIMNPIMKKYGSEYKAPDLIDRSMTEKKRSGQNTERTIKWYIVVSLLIFAFGISAGQEFNYYTQYMFNGLAINPAYAGSHDYISLTGDVRKQWVGMKGAPSTQTFSIHSPVLNDQFGLGLILINDNISVTSQQEVSINYSYKLRFPAYSLSMGLKLGLNTLSSRFDELYLLEEQDDNFLNSKRAYLPVFGIGAYLKSKDYYVGLSVPYLYKFIHRNYENSNTNLNRLVLLTGGYIYKINNEFSIKPSILAKADIGSIFEMDLNANVYYKDDYCVGISYKSLNSLALIAEIGFNKSVYIGYSYDLTTSKLIRYQAGTHEISLNVYLNKNEKAKIVNPRYF
jgi:type IX secretion system PorP/SprF family membrane protein